MNSSAPCPSLKTIPEVSYAEVTALRDVLRHAEVFTGPSSAPSDKSAQATTKHAVLPTTAPSSSNGETLLLHTSQAADTTNDQVDAFAEATSASLVVGQRVTSIELSPSPSTGSTTFTQNDDFPEETALASPAPFTNHPDEDSGLMEVHPEATPHDARSVWTRQVRVGPSFSSVSGKAKAYAMSEAAAHVIAQALSRASLLHRCLEIWQRQRLRQEQRRQHQERFAQGYYERNLRYLMFRAWQWRFASRRRRAEVQQRAAALRRRKLCQRAFDAWHAWKLRQQSNRRCVQQLLLGGRAELRERYFGKWHRCRVMREQARALERASLQQTQRCFFEEWCAAVLKRKRRRLLGKVLALHTPAAWASAEGVGCGNELLVRLTWIQWLRVAAQRRATRLRYRAACTETLSRRTERAQQRGRYTTWLRVTFATLQCRRMRQALTARYFLYWCHVGSLRVQENQWVERVRRPRLVHRCVERWRLRCRDRERQRELTGSADIFASTVVQTHTVQRAFQQWYRRWSSRARMRRMRRVAEAYARPALLRHLFLRRITDGVLSAVVNPEPEADRAGVEWSDVENSSASVAHQTGVKVNERPPRAPLTKEVNGGTPAPLVSLASMRPPIPLHRSPLTQHSVQPTQDATAKKAQPAGKAEREEEGTPAPSSVVSAGETTATLHAPQRPPQQEQRVTPPPSTQQAPPPPPDCFIPPPTYAEVMRMSAATATTTVTLAPRSSVLLHTRADVGVGTETAVTAPVKSVEKDKESDGGRDAQGSNVRGASPAFPSLPLPQQLLPISSAAPPAAYSIPPFYALTSPPYTVPLRWVPSPHPAASSTPVFSAVPTPCEASSSTTQAVKECSPTGVVAAATATPIAFGTPCVPHLLPCAAAQLYSPGAHPPHLTPRPSSPVSLDEFPREVREWRRGGGWQPSSFVPTHNGCYVHRYADPFSAAAGAGAPAFLTLPSCCSSPGAADGPCQSEELQEGSFNGGVRREAPVSGSLAETAKNARVDGPSRSAPSRLTPAPRSSLLPAAERRLPLNRITTATTTRTTTQEGNTMTTPMGHQDAIGGALHRQSSDSTLGETAGALECGALSAVADACSTQDVLSDAARVLQPVDSAAFRLTVRRILDDYNARTRLLPSEKAELETIESRLHLERQLGVATERSEEELRGRQRYLQTRLLQWQQRRAKVAQLTVLLEEKMHAKSSAAASQVGSE